MKNDEMVTDANMLVTQNTITQDQIEEVNIYLEYEEGSRLLTNLGYSFYYNLMQQNMHPADADRYANLNTILGYDVGKDIFTAIVKRRKTILPVMLLSKIYGKHCRMFR